MSGIRASSLGLRGGSDEELVDRDAARSGDGEADDLRDVVGGDRRGVVELLDRLLGLAVGDVVDGSVLTAPGSMTMTRTSGWSSWRSDSDQPFSPHLVAA